MLKLSFAHQSDTCAQGFCHATIVIVPSFVVAQLTIVYLLLPCHHHPCTNITQIMMAIFCSSLASFVFLLQTMTTSSLFSSLLFFFLFNVRGSNGGNEQHTHCHYQVSIFFLFSCTRMWLQIFAFCHCPNIPLSLPLFSL